MPKIITARFRLDGTPKLGLSPTIDVYNATTDAVVVNDGAMTEMADGLYKYIFLEANGFDPRVDFVYTADGTASITNDFERFQEGACCASEPEEIADGVWEADQSLYADLDTMGGRHNATFLNTVQLLLDVDFIRKFQTNRTRIDTILNTLTVFDDDDTTPLHVFNLQDGSGVGSSDPVCERVPQ